MDEEKAGVEELLRRGEELLQQTSDEAQREELRLMLLRLQSQYSSHRVGVLKLSDFAFIALSKQNFQSRPNVSLTC